MCGICRSGGSPRVSGRAKLTVASVVDGVHTWTSQWEPAHKEKRQGGRAEDAGDVFTALAVQQTHQKDICCQPTEPPLKNAWKKVAVEEGEINASVFMSLVMYCDSTGNGQEEDEEAQGGGGC